MLAARAARDAGAHSLGQATTARCKHSAAVGRIQQHSATVSSSHQQRGVEDRSNLDWHRAGSPGPGWAGYRVAPARNTRLSRRLGERARRDLNPQPPGSKPGALSS